MSDQDFRPEEGFPQEEQSPVTPPETPAAPPPAEPTPPPNGWQNGAQQWTPPPSGWQQQTPPQYTWSTPQQPTTPPPTPPRKNHAAIWIAVLGTLCALCLLIPSVMLLVRTVSTEQGATNNTRPQSSPTIPAGDRNTNAPDIVTNEPAKEGLYDREIVSANLNSTVIIRMYMTVSSGYFSSSEEEMQAGEATGIVWTEDGYIITNAHCVFSEEYNRVFSRIEVELYDGTVFSTATVVGYDTTTDLAVIKVDAEKLTPATFGDSDALQLGDRVLALGNNSGLGWTVTGGMVSGLARDVYEETNYAIKCLQVDAVINPGNSGGPLLNSSGQVVGINSAKIVAEGYEGLGFSIPINEAKKILQDLVSYGYVKGRVMLGIEGYTFDTYRGYEGFYISAIGKDSCFVGTAAQVGDIITHINDVRVKSYAEMREQLTSYAVGDTVTVTLMRIRRNNPTVETVTVSITLIESDGTV